MKTSKLNNKMKKLIMVVAVVIMATGAQAQGEGVTKFFSKYSNNDAFTQINVSSKMFGLFTNMEVEKPEDQEILNAISKIKGLRVIAKSTARDSRELYKEALSMVPKDYEELLIVRDKDEDMKFLIKEGSPGKIVELLMVSADNSDFKLISIFGEIDLKQISKIGSRLNIDGLEKLNRMDKDDDHGKKE